MPARCPRCQGVVERDATGALPASCPHCGAQFKTKSTSAPGASDDPFGSLPGSGLPGKSKNPFAGETPAEPASPTSGGSGDLPFQPGGSSKPSPFDDPPPPARAKAKSASGRPEATPFGGPAPAKAGPARTVKRGKGSTELPTGPAIGGSGGLGTPTSPVAARRKRGGSGVAIGVTLTVLALVGVGGFFLLLPILNDTGGSRGESRNTGPQITNAAANYVFTAPSKQWQQAKWAKPEEKVPLALERPDLDAWIGVDARKVPEKRSLRRRADELASRWRSLGYTESGREQTKVAGQPALLLRADSAETQRMAYLFAGEDIEYELILEAPRDALDELTGDFTLAKEGFAFARPVEETGPAFGSGEMFASYRAPYQVRVPGSRWVEDPEMQGVSLWADLKLASSKLDDAFVVVTPREVGDPASFDERLAKLKEFYLYRLRKQFEGATVTPRPEVTTTIDGYPAQQFDVVVENSGRSFFVRTTFVLDRERGRIFQIECRAPEDLLDVYDPIFTAALDSFDITEEIPGEPPPEPTAVASRDRAPGGFGMGTPAPTGDPPPPLRVPGSAGESQPGSAASSANEGPRRVAIPEVDLARFFDDDYVPDDSGTLAADAPAMAGTSSGAGRQTIPEIDLARFFDDDYVPEPAPSATIARANTRPPGSVDPSSLPGADVPVSPGGEKRTKVDGEVTFDELEF